VSAASVIIVGVIFCVGLCTELTWRIFHTPDLDAAPRQPSTLDGVIGTAAYRLAQVLALLRLPLTLLPYVAKLLLHFALPIGYKTKRRSEIVELFGIIGDVANLGLTTIVVTTTLGETRPAPLVYLAYLPLAAEGIRLVCEKGRMCSSAIWQIMPHRQVAKRIAIIDQPSCRAWRILHPLSRYRRYYLLTDDDRLSYTLASLKREAALDPPAAHVLTYVQGFRIVPTAHSLRAGWVRDVAAGEIFVHRRWTSDPDLIIGQALRHSPWLFDPRHLERPFRYRGDSNRLGTLLVLR
jgi:hypothetical protein